MTTDPTLQWPLQRDCLHFYGDPRSKDWLHDNTVDVVCPWAIHMGRIQIKNILIHKKCEQSLIGVLGAIWEAVGKDPAKIAKLGYDQYDGSYNFRPMRGGQAWSMHSFACAIDWDAGDNPFHSRKHKFTADDLLVVKFTEAGWIWGGSWSAGSVDSMHVQAARIR